MTFCTTQTIYFLKPYDTQYPLTHWPLTHHPTQTHQAHHMAFWVSHSLLCLSFIIYLCSPNKILFSNFTNNYFVWSWTFNPLKCKTPLFFKYLCNHPFDPRYHLFLFYFWAAKRETEKLLILTFQKFFSKWHWYSKIMTACWIVIKIMIFPPSDSPFLDTLSDFQPLVALLSNSCVFNDPPLMLLGPPKMSPNRPKNATKCIF